MEKRADGADASVLIFSLCCANFLAVNGKIAKTLDFSTVLFFAQNLRLCYFYTLFHLWLELFGIVLNCLELLKSYKWVDWTDWTDWTGPAEKPSPLKAPAVLKIDVYFAFQAILSILFFMKKVHFLVFLRFGLVNPWQIQF